MARYIYEHWYLAHLFFKQLPVGEFFRLVRSRTPPGESIDRISTRRPYDAPGVDKVYYRFWREKGTIVSKTHMPYALDDARLNWIDELFLQKSYIVEALPSHQPEVAANPFIAFEAIPVATRWRFLIEEAQFTIMNFMKGSVCRGQVALNVINDHFWVFFTNPEFIEQDDEGAEDFYARNKEHLRMPNEEESNVRPLKTWKTYSNLQKKHLAAKTAWLNENAGPDLLTLDLIWDGNGENENAALTIFRHFDSASVVKGVVGQAPKTAWLIDYSLLERIHYLLVAGYDVYGNLGHQVTTRLYMDFLRMEGEFNFLALIPAQDRQKILGQWYQDASESVKDYLYGEHTNFYKQTGITYQTTDVKSELFEKIKEHLNPVISRKYDLDSSTILPGHWQQLDRLSHQQGLFASLLPQTTFLTVLNDGKPSYYTLIHNNEHTNITSLFLEKNNRLPEKDYVTVVKGFLGNYPGALWQVEANKLSLLVDDVLSLSSASDYKMLMDNYGIRRTDNQFWEKSDEIHQAYYDIDPTEAGLFDFNRLENR